MTSKTKLKAVGMNLRNPGYMARLLLLTNFYKREKFRASGRIVGLLLPMGSC